MNQAGRRRRWLASEKVAAEAERGMTGSTTDHASSRRRQRHDVDDSRRQQLQQQQHWLLDEDNAVLQRLAQRLPVIRVSDRHGQLPQPSMA